MARSFKTQLSGQMGESLVVAELGRRDIVATAFAGNVPDIDLLAYKDGKTLHLQVKAWRAGAVSFNAKRFLDIKFDGDIQSVSGVDDTLDKHLIYVFVQLSAQRGLDRFFLLTQGDLQTMMQTGYSAYLEKHNGVRPRNSQTTHSAVFLSDLEPYEDNWQLVEQRLA